ncbi:MAG: tetratricopeptide repeat protein [Salinivirgaceae bacterium]|nr:tetratricopeptide repeat protein [Salinivirgaceae bacterium]
MIREILVSLVLIFSALSLLKAANVKKYEELYAKYEDSYDAGDYSASVSYLEQAMPNIPSDSIYWFSDTYNGLAYAYWRLGNFDKAVDFGQRALDCDYEIGDSARISTSLSIMAAIFAHQRLFADAEQYMRRSIDYALANDSLILATRYSVFGEILSAQNKHAEAISSIIQAYKLDSIGNRAGKVAVRLSQLGAAYMQSGDYKKAETCLAQATEKLKAIGNNTSLSINLIAQTKNYMALGRNADAEKAAAECLQITEQIGQRKTKLDALRFLAALRNSPQLYKQTLSLSDSLYNEQISQQIADFEVRYATAEKEREIAQQQVTIERQQSALIVLVIVLTAIFIALVLVFIIRRMRRDIEHTEKMARELFVTPAQTGIQTEKTSAATQQAASEPASQPTVEQPGDAADQNVLKQQESAVADAQSAEKPEQPDIQLSPREIQIICACSQGKLSKEIADELGISKRTVENHKYAIYQKLGICNNTELILYAVKHEIVKM